MAKQRKQSPIVSMEPRYGGKKANGKPRKAYSYLRCSRSVFNVTDYLVEQVSIMPPRFLKWLYSFIIGRLKRKGINTSRKLSDFLFRLDALVKDIGFRRFYYVRTVGAEGRMKNDKEIHSYVLPCDVPFEYDDRARRNEYKAKDLPLETQ